MKTHKHLKVYKLYKIVTNMHETTLSVCNLQFL